MSNLARLAVSLLVAAALSLIAYAFPLTPLLYFFAPGFWLGNALSDGVVNSLGGYLFPVFASALIWTLLIFSAWLLLAQSRKRSRR
jgi:hypothetical protein